MLFNATWSHVQLSESESVWLDVAPRGSIFVATIIRYISQEVGRAPAVFMVTKAGILSQTLTKLVIEQSTTYL